MKSILIFFVVLLAVSNRRANAQPLTALDSTFSQDGILDVDSLKLTSIGRMFLALQPDGKILTAGTYAYWPPSGQHQMGAHLMRFHPNGVRDSTFGQNGELLLRGNGNENCIGLHVQPDGRIVTATASSVFQSNSYTLHRLLPSGAPDPSFNDSGKVVFAPTLSPGHTYYNAMAVQPDGGVLFTGHWSHPPLFHFLNSFRHTAAGVPDSSYGLHGRASVELFNTYKIDGRVIAAQADGGFLVGGTAQDTPLSFNRNKAVLARCLANGTLDTSFGASLGFIKHTTTGERHSAITSVLIHPSGKILAAVISQRVYDGPWKISVMQLTTTGTLDAVWGNGGIAVVDSSAENAVWSSPPQLALQADGRVLVSFADGMDTATRRFAVRRLTTSGTPDASFGAGGKVTTRVSAARPGGATGIAVQPNGKILVAGTSVHAMSGYTSLGMVRYHPFISFAGIAAQNNRAHLRIYPNPTNESVELQYFLNAATDVRISVLDLQGRVHQHLVRTQQSAGLHSETLSLGGSLPPGSYIVTLRGADIAASITIVKQ